LICCRGDKNVKFDGIFRVLVDAVDRSDKSHKSVAIA